MTAEILQAELIMVTCNFLTTTINDSIQGCRVRENLRSHLPPVFTIMSSTIREKKYHLFIGHRVQPHWAFFITIYLKCTVKEKSMSAIDYPNF